jgi:hypothetical protein
MDDTTGRGEAGVWEEYTEEKPKPIDRLLSPPGVSLVFAALFPAQGGNMWWIFGFAIAVVIAAAYVLTRRPTRRTTIVVDRD